MATPTVQYDPTKNLYVASSGETFGTHDEAAKFLNPQLVTGTDVITARGAVKPTSTPITTLSSPNGANAIQDMRTRTQTMTPIPPTTPTKPTEPAPTKTATDVATETLAQEGLAQADKDKIAREERAAARTKVVTDQVATLTAYLDSSKAAMLQGIGEQYNRIIAQQEETNKRYEATVRTYGIRSGGNAEKYTGEITAGIYQTSVNEGLARVADIVSKRNEMIASVNSAYDSKKFTLMSQQFEQLNKINDDLDTELQNISKEQRKMAEEQLKQNKIADTESAVLNSVQGGNTDVASVYRALGGTVDTKTIKDIMDRITPKESKDTTTNAFKFSNDDAGYFMSKGMGGQDIQTLQDVLNESGLYGKSEKLGGKTLSEALTPDELKAVKERLYTPPKTEKDIYDETYISPEWKGLVDTTGNLYSTKSIGDEVKKSIVSAIKSEDYTTAYAQVANAVEEKLTGDVKTKFANSRTDYMIIQNFSDSIQKYADAGGDMGLLTGKEEEIKRKLGIDSGKATELAVQLWREFQTYRLNMTGAAFSEKESNDYASVNPTLGKSLNLNLSIINGALNQLENRITSTVNVRVPGASKLYGFVEGNNNSITPETANTGDIFEYGGVRYKKVGDDAFEEVK